MSSYHDLENHIEDINEKNYLAYIGGRLFVFRHAPQGPGESSIRSSNWVPYTVRDWLTKMKNQNLVIPPENKKAKPKNINLGKYWIEHPNRHEYEYVAYRPDTEPDLPNKGRNLWEGWNLSQDHINDVTLMSTPQKEAQPIIDYFYNVVAGGVDKTFEWLMHFFAELYHNASSFSKPGHAPILISPPGFGKTVALRIIGGPFGVHALEIGGNPAAIFGRFNDHLRTASFVGGNEITRHRVKDANERLKSLITDDTLDTEAKNQKMHFGNNYLRFMFTSNEDLALPIEFFDRRFTTINLSDQHKNDRNYYGELMHIYNNGGKEAFWLYLERYDYKNFDFADRPNQTESHKVQIAATEKATIRGWIWHFVSNESLSYPPKDQFETGEISLGLDHPVEIKASRLLECYNTYLDSIGQGRFKTNARVFGGQIKIYNDNAKVPIKKLTRRPDGWYYQMPSITELLTDPNISSMIDKGEEKHDAKNKDKDKQGSTGYAEPETERHTDKDGNVSFY